HPDHLHLPSLAAAAGTEARIIAPQAVYDLLPAELQPRVTVLANGQTAEVSGVVIEAVAMYNLGILPLHPRGRGNGYVVTLGGTRFYIAGDTDDTPELRALTDIDVAFLPMRPPFTMGVEEAAAAALALAPAIVYPYHYGSD